jgi:hypothetical protein
MAANLHLRLRPAPVDDRLHHDAQHLRHLDRLHHDTACA